MRHSCIEGLCGQITYAFENPDGSFLRELKEAVDNGLLSPTIELEMDNAEFKTPSIKRKDINSPATISISIDYLESLWAFIYGWFVVYEECIQRKWIEGKFTGEIIYDTKLKLRACQLNDWSIVNNVGTTPYPNGLPSPTCWATEEEHAFTKLANKIFIDAISFVLHHEYAHLRNGHFDFISYSNSSLPLLKESYIQLEQEADEFAFHSLISQADTEQTRRLRCWSILAPLLHMAASVKKPAGFSTTRHPAIHHRIRNNLARINFDKLENQFYFDYLCFAVLSNSAVLSFNDKNQNEIFETANEALEDILDVLDMQSTVTKEG